MNSPLIFGFDFLLLKHEDFKILVFFGFIKVLLEKLELLDFESKKGVNLNSGLFNKKVIIGRVLV